MCTVHSFPHNIDHCLTWARSEFEGLLEKGPAEANAYLADPGKYIDAVRTSADAAAREQLAKVVDVLCTEQVGGVRLGDVGGVNGDSTKHCWGALCTVQVGGRIGVLLCSVWGKIGRVGGRVYD
jgi:hypothetical protein